MDGHKRRCNAHRDAMRARLAELLGLQADAVNVKARTMEGLGPVGAGEALAAQAVVVLEATPNI